MTLADRKLTIDVYDTSGVLEEVGPLFNVLEATVTQELDKAGEVEIVVPANDTRALALLAVETTIYIRTAEGIVGRGLVQNYDVRPGDKPTFVLSGLDLLGELNDFNTGYAREYDNANVSTAIIGTHATATTLLYGTSWTQGTVTIAASVATWSLVFNAETILQALGTLGKALGHHFRQGSTARTLDFGVFGVDSGLRILNIDHARYGQAGSALQGYITSFSANTISADIENKIFPLGKNGFDLRDAQYTATATSGAITAASNATPIQITSAGHGLSNGDIVRVGGVEGNTAANGYWAITTAGVDDFTLDSSVGSGAWTAGGTFVKLTAITDILARADQGPLGVTTTVSGGQATGTTVNVTAVTGFRVGDEIWIGDADDWTAAHEVALISAIAGSALTVTAALRNTYAAAVDVLQRPQFYIQDATSVAAYGVKEGYPQFNWIGAPPGAASADMLRATADTLYQAATSHRTRYKDPYQQYTVGEVIDLPLSLQVGDKIRLTYTGTAGPYGAAYLSIDADFYVLKITRKFYGDGRGGARGISALVVANVARPTPDNTTLVVYNLDTGRYLGL